LTLSGTTCIRAYLSGTFKQNQVSNLPELSDDELVAKFAADADRQLDFA
jgi:hypothetical protein